jgi:universal stress protein E
VKNLRSVLVILDKPKHVQSALLEAQKIQHKNQAQLRLVSFVWQAMAEQKAVFNAQQRRAMKREIIRAREVWVRELISEFDLLNAATSVEVQWTDDIGSWVSEEAHSRCDLVLKSVHRSQTLLHTPLDWQLIRDCPVPLMLVGASASNRRRTAKPKTDVLATLDLRNQDRKHEKLNLQVLDAASRFAELRGGKLHCIAVVEFSEVLSDLEVIDPRKVQKAAIAASDEFLQQLIKPYGIARSRVHRPAGKVGHLVAATVRKSGSGLVVVGSAARRGLGARLVGNSAEKILARSPADVLIVHP